MLCCAAAAAVLVYHRRWRRRLAGDDKRGAGALSSTGVPLGGGDGIGGVAEAAEWQAASERAAAAAMGTLPPVQERIEDELSAPLATFPTRPSSVSPAGAATLLGLAPPRPAAPAAPPSTAGLSQPQTPSLSSAGESLGSSGGRLSRWGWIEAPRLASANAVLQASIPLGGLSGLVPLWLWRFSSEGLAFPRSSLSSGPSQAPGHWPSGTRGGPQRRRIPQLLHADAGVLRSLPACLCAHCLP